MPKISDTAPLVKGQRMDPFEFYKRYHPYYRIVAHQQQQQQYSQNNVPHSTNNPSNGQGQVFGLESQLQEFDWILQQYQTRNARVMMNPQPSSSIANMNKTQPSTNGQNYLDLTLKAATVESIKRQLEEEARSFETSISILSHYGRPTNDPATTPCCSICISSNNNNNHVHPSHSRPSVAKQIAMPTNSHAAAEIKSSSLCQTTKKMEEPTSSSDKNLSSSDSNAEEDANQCIVCLEEKKTHILIPCGHYSYCEPCANSLKTCGLCRKKISKRVKVYEA